MRLGQELEIAQELALAAGKAVKAFRSKKLQPIRGTNSAVTIPDLIADDIIISGLQAAFPRDALCSEQTPISGGRFECDRLWLVDALDGAMNCSAAGDEYTVSIGLAIRGQAVLGVVYNPSRDELFAGVVGEPPPIDGHPMKPSMTDQFAGARICIASSDWELYSCLAGIPECPPLLPIVSTSYGLARVAAGLDNGFISLRPCREWSTCAGVALIDAAGCRASLRGSLNIVYNRGDLTHPFGITAANRDLHKRLDGALIGMPRQRLCPAA